MSDRWFNARIWLLKKIPAGFLWHPFEWFMAGACAIAGVASMTGHVESDSLRALLPLVFLRLWGLALLIGSAALGSGLSSIRAVSADRYVITRVPAYRLGLRLLALAVVVYIGALVLYAGTAAVLASVTPAAFVAMCGVRLLSLGGRR